MARRAGNASDALRPCFPVNRKRGLRRGKYSWVLLGRECMGAVRATWHVPWLLAVVMLLRLGGVCSTSLRVPSYHEVGRVPQVPTTHDLPLSLTLRPNICSLLLSHTQADLNKESTKDNLGVNIKKTELLNH